MCYDIAAFSRKLDKLEKRYGNLSYDNSVWCIKTSISAFTKPHLPVIAHNSPNEITSMQWGFEPPFANTEKDAKIWISRSPNCRGDDLLTKLKEKKRSMFSPMVNTPIVLLVDGFFEWHTVGKTKYRYFHYLKDKQMFPLAGFCTEYQPFGSSEKILGFTVLTIPANELVGKIHNLPQGSPDLRMPAILTPEEVKTWLDTSLKATDRLGMLNAYPAEDMEAYTVINPLQKAARNLAGTEKTLAPFNYGVSEAPAFVDGANLEGIKKDLFS
ncbi:MAG: SOS response-associated peptidase family protein [Bacteroidetes bacterium]|nr:SOS response-associated peptidase family protein [Bacteroidota bacterium]